MFERILVPIDTSPSADRALDCAIAFAADQNAALRVVHVIETPVGSLFDVNGVDLVKSERIEHDRSRPILDAAAERARESGVVAECAILPSEGSKPSEVILAEAGRWDAGLLIIGTGRKGVGRLVFGSVADEIVHSTEIPVMIV